MLCVLAGHNGLGFNDMVSMFPGPGPSPHFSGPLFHLIFSLIALQSRFSFLHLSSLCYFLVSKSSLSLFLPSPAGFVSSLLSLLPCVSSWFSGSVCLSLSLSLFLSPWFPFFPLKCDSPDIENNPFALGAYMDKCVDQTSDRPLDPVWCCW